jgi:hypothetical protein
MSLKRIAIQVPFVLTLAGAYSIDSPMTIVLFLANLVACQWTVAVVASLVVMYKSYPDGPSSMSSKEKIELFNEMDAAAVLGSIVTMLIYTVFRLAWMAL